MERARNTPDRGLTGRYHALSVGWLGCLCRRGIIYVYFKIFLLLLVFIPVPLLSFFTSYSTAALVQLFPVKLCSRRRSESVAIRDPDPPARLEPILENTRYRY